MSAASDVGARLAELEERLARLEARLEGGEEPPRPPHVLRQRNWVLEVLKDTADDPGAVLFGGVVTMPDDETYEWQMQEDAGKLLARDWTEFSETITAIAHPVRLRLVREIVHGTRTVAELQENEAFGTTGQLYHHLRQLVSAGWLRADGKGRYSVPVERIVPLLALLLAADSR